MKFNRSHHWITVALVLAALLLTLNEAHGQSSGTAATFEGRPAMAGAQGGLGAQAGPPQGGIGVQGSDKVSASDLERPGKEVRPGKDIKPPADQSVAKDQRSAAKKVKRAAKRTITRGRHGVSEIDTADTTQAR